MLASGLMVPDTGAEVPLTFHDASEDCSEEIFLEPQDSFGPHPGQTDDAQRQGQTSAAASDDAEDLASSSTAGSALAEERLESGPHEAEEHIDEEQLNEDSETDQEKLARAEGLKLAGNVLYRDGKHDEALAEYDAALTAAPSGAVERAVYLANAAACHLVRQRYSECVRCCSDALAVDATYVKAMHRRMAAHEAMDKLDMALEDAKLILERSPDDLAVRQKVQTWEPIVKERQEKMKEEVLGKLKDLGNNILGRFGMSVDNFKMVQDPSTGSYSINFQR